MKCLIYITGKPKLEIETFCFPDLMYFESNNGEMFQYIKSSLEISMKVSDFGMNTKHVPREFSFNCII